MFDGTSPPYHEDASPNPLNAYGKTKLLGEEATLGVSSGEKSTQKIRISLINYFYVYRAPSASHPSSLWAC